MLQSLQILGKNHHRFVKQLGCCAYAATTTATKEKWDLLTAVCLERKPVITPPLNEIEKKFQALLNKREFENSIKSDTELRHEQEVKQLELLKKGDADVDLSLKATVQDFIDMSNEELSQFKTIDKVTEADKKNDITSLNRKLDKYLVFLIKQKLGNKDHFLLPQGLRQDGETLRQAAERILNESCGGDIKAQFYGNAPSGFYKFKYPKKVQEQKSVVGAKVFIYLAKYCKGNVSNNASEYKWLDKKELKGELHSDYYNSVSQFLIDEE